MSEVTRTPAVPAVSRPDYVDEILQLISKTLSPKALREALEDFHASDIADAFSELDQAQREKLFRMLDVDRLAEIIPYLDEEEQTEYLKAVNVKKTLAIMAKMEPHKAAQILRGFSRTRRDVIFELLDSDTRTKLTRIYAYAEDEIGSQMTTDFIEISRSDDVKTAMRKLRDQTRATNTDNISILYVTDENNQYYGAIRTQNLFAARADQVLETIIEVNFPFVYASEEIVDIMDDLKDYEEDSIPVLNNLNQIVGIITRQDLLEVFESEMSEDYARLAGLSAQEDLEETLPQSLKKRTPWLVTLLFLSLCVSSVISMFEGVVARLTIAIVFQSLILGMAGNVGTQSLAVSIRVLADPDITRQQKFQLIFKEVRTGLSNGLVIGSLSALVLGLFIHLTASFDWGESYAIALCIGLSMCLSMIISSFTGTGIPMLFEKFGIDPAAASGPLITTTNDLIGAATYYSLIWLLLLGGMA